MSGKISKQQKTEYEEAFCYFDRDHDGAITINELTQVLKCLGQNPTESELKTMIREADKKGDGKIRMEEFMNMMAKMSKTAISADELIRAFRYFDPEQTGFMPVAELKHALKVIGEKLSNKEIDEMFKGAELDNRGNINYRSLVKSLVS